MSDFKTRLLQETNDVTEKKIKLELLITQKIIESKLLTTDNFRIALHRGINLTIEISTLIKKLLNKSYEK